MSQKKKKTWLMAGLLCFAVLVMDNSNLTSASFDGNGGKKNRLRLPASVTKDSIEFDCKQVHEKMEVTTPLETLRIEIKNCPGKVSMQNMNLKQALHVFPVNATLNSHSSEFAYLARGENVFTIEFEGQKRTLVIFRF